MEDHHDCNRKFPPRSKFNDEEATAVLRLIIEQEKLLKNANVSPLLNVSSNRLQRLPPLNAKRSESLDENELENVRTRKQSGQRDGSELFLNKPTLLNRNKEQSTCENIASLPGRPSRVPDIYSSPKMARHRDRGDRPKGSYGRTRHSGSDTHSVASSDENINNEHHENGYSTMDSGYLEEGEDNVSSKLVNTTRYSASYIN